MERLYQTYKDIAEFRIVYIREAHASDSSWPVGYAKEKGITEHTSYEDRCTTAEMLLEDKNLNIPCIIDDMEDSVNEAYGAWPDRVYLVRSDGRLAVAGKRGPWGFKPALDEVAEWLAAFDEAGEEPPLPEGALEAANIRAKELREAERRLEESANEAKTDRDDADAHLDEESSAKTDTQSEGDEQVGEQASAKTDARQPGEDADDKTDDASPSDPSDRSFASLVGEWEMVTSLNGQAIEADMILTFEDGIMGGVWRSMGREMEITDIAFDGSTLKFKRSLGEGGASLQFEGEVNGNAIDGRWAFGNREIESTGTTTQPGADNEDADTEADADAKEPNQDDHQADGDADEQDKEDKEDKELAAYESRYPMGPKHSRPIIERDGRTLLWARGRPGTDEAEWFDMTNALVDPTEFQYGIGKDRIPSIDDPKFAKYGDPKLAEMGITDQTEVIGFERNGIARAYPIWILNGHEVVNDNFAGEPFAVCW